MQKSYRAVRHRVSVVVLATLAAHSSLALAEDTTTLPEIQVTASRSEQALADVPQAISVVDSVAVARETPQVLTDLLRGQAGVFLQSSGPGQGIVIVRGLKGSEVLHMVDGMRLNMAFFRNSPSQYVALVDPYNIARVELLRGATGGTLYGSDALGGVLQVLTPEHHFDGDQWQLAGKLRALYSSADLARIGRAEFAVGKSGFSLSGGYTTMDYGQRALAGGEREPFTSYAMRGGDTKLLWSPTAGHELMLSAQFMESPKLPRYFEIVGGPGGEGSGLPVYFEPNDRQFLHARYRINQGLGFVEQLEVHLAQQLINDDRNRLVDTATFEEEQNRSTLNGLTVQAVSQTGAVHWTYGVDLYDDEVDSAKARTDLTTLEIKQRDPTFPDGATTRDLGVYVDAGWQATPRWLLQGGARYSNIETELTATSASAAATVKNDDVSIHLASAFALTSGLRWTANLSRGFRAPNLFDLGTLGPRPGTSPQVINVPNPDLEKETIVSADTGLRWSADGLRAELSVFQAWHDNRIESREPTGETIPQGQYGCKEADGCTEVRSENLAEATLWGIEWALHLELDKQLEIEATLNHTYGEETKKGDTRPANRIPPVNGQVGLVWLPSATLRIEPYVRFAAEQRRLDDDDQGDVRISPNGTPGWATTNLRLGYTPFESLQLQLDGINLLDQAYREHGSGIDGQGAGVIAGATYRF